MTWYVSDDVESIGMCWYDSPNSGKTTCIVVEDQPSALRASTYLPSVALLGTNLSYESVRALGKEYSTIYLALDRDATAKAFEYVKRYNTYGLKWFPLDKDLKDLTRPELAEKLSGLS